jgi:hypothetical protein
MPVFNEAPGFSRGEHVTNLIQLDSGVFRANWRRAVGTPAAFVDDRDPRAALVNALTVAVTTLLAPAVELGGLFD